MSRSANAAAVTAGVALALVAFWATVHAEFLAHPGWLAVQKADLVVGPVLVGVYWRRARPASRFGWMLIGFGLLNGVYVAQSSSVPSLFGLGLVWESVIYLGTQLLIVTFPTGRLDGTPARLVLAASAVAAAFNVWLVTMLPHTSAGGAISGCRSVCPRNGLALVPNPSRALGLLEPLEGVVIAVALATLLLLGWRFVRGTPPQRRELAVGTLVAVSFLVCQTTYLSLTRFHVDAPHAAVRLQWAFTVARSCVWYGFLVGLVAAQLYAGRALQRILRASLARPTITELGHLLRAPLGDPGLQLRLWDPATETWDGPVAPGPREAATVIDRDGSPAVAIVHDARLQDEPELMQAAGTVALLAADNAALDAEWHRTLDRLARSRAQVVRAVDDERRRFAADLHDGLQQRLVAVRLRLAALARLAPDARVEARAEEIGADVEEAIAEVRDAAHRLHPRALRELGLVGALELALRPVPVRAADVPRHGPEIESAVYYSVLETVQNALKHGGERSSVDVSIRRDRDRLRFDVSDDGTGFDPSASEGMGLQNIRDRVAEVGGELRIESRPGLTVVSGSIPLDRAT